MNQPRERFDAIVVGAGIAGLTAAWHLKRTGVNVALIESRDKVGGSIDTEHRDGFLLEKGPFNVMVRDPAFEELLTGLADRVKVVTASSRARNRYIYRHGKLNAVPTGPIKFLCSPLVSFKARLRAVRGLFFSARGKKEETTIEEFAARRFGQEVADAIVSAAIAGILAGDIRKLSAYACFPVLRDFDTKSFSPMGRTVRRVPSIMTRSRNPKKRRQWKGLVSIDRGLGGLCDAIAEEIGPNVRTNTKVEAIQRDRNVYMLRAIGGDGPATFACDELILATPVQAAANLLEPHLVQASSTMRTIESASLTVLNLAFKKEDVAHPLDGFGFLVPQIESEFPLMGTLFANSAFPHHAPSEYQLLRVFFGGTRTPDVIERDDEELIETARKSLYDLLGAKGEPVLVDVCPYPDAIPQYYLDHIHKVEKIYDGVKQLKGLHLTGNYLEGVSINDCIKLSKKVALIVAERCKSQK